jgi:hypothetical protein
MPFSFIFNQIKIYSMKNLMLICLLFAGIKSFAQVTKADIELQMATFSPAGYEYVFLSNVREYYNDGSFKMVQKNYYGNMLTMEPKEHALYIRFYTDATKTSLSDLTVIPYSMIIRTEAYKTGFVIDVME